MPNKEQAMLRLAKFKEEMAFLKSSVGGGYGLLGTICGGPLTGAIVGGVAAIAIHWHLSSQAGDYVEEMEKYINGERSTEPAKPTLSLDHPMGG